MALHRSSTESEAKSHTDSTSDCGPNEGNQPIRWCRCDDKNAQINQILSTKTMTERLSTVGKSMAQPSTTYSIDSEAAPQPARNDPLNREATPKPAEKQQLNREATSKPAEKQQLNLEATAELAKIQSLDRDSSPGMQSLDRESSTQPAEDMDIEAVGQHSLVAYSSSVSPDKLEHL